MALKGRRPLSNDEISRMLEAFKGDYAARDRALFTLGICSGFRVGEMLSLAVRDVLVDGQIVEAIIVRKANTKGQVASRGVVLHPLAREALMAWLQDLQRLHGVLLKNTFLFQGRSRGNRAVGYYQCWRVLKRTARDAGVDAHRLGMHSLRKSFAQRVWAASGRDLLTTQQVMGHVKPESTAAYLSTIDGEVERLVLEMDLPGLPDEG